MWIPLRHCFLGRWNRHTGRSALAMMLMSGCQNSAEIGDPRACQQTYEFGNTGCFEVAGQVVGARGQTLSGITIGARPIVGPGVLFSSTYPTTDAMGQFRIRLSRMLGQPPSDARPDTLSVFVIAADLRTASPGVPAYAVDSVRTLVAVAPVGAISVTAEIRIILPVP